MTDTPTTTPDETTESKAAPRRSGGALGGKVLAELQEIAAGLGITGAKKMRKGELIDAIKSARGESAPVAVQAADAPAQQPVQKERPQKADRETAAQAPAQEQLPTDAESSEAPSKDTAPTAATEQPADDQKSGGQRGRRTRNDGQNGGGPNSGGNDANAEGGQKQDAPQQGKQDGPKQGKQDGQKQKDNGSGNDQNGQGGKNKNGRGQGNQGQQNGGQRGDDQDQGDDEQGGRRRNRRGRNRGGRGADGEPTYSDDDVLVPAAGILDILDNYAFVRTTGYLPSENDVYVSLSMVRKWGLRKGDAVTGQVRQPREGERKEKFNPMVRVDSVNGTPLEEARGRADFERLTPLFADERLTLETGADALTARVIDLFAPIGKGQRGLVLSPSKAGKTTVLRSIAQSVSVNNPECHLMVVLVDERPEEVTEMQRAVKGEVIASTFDRPAADHTTVAELAIERAKRLVELGHDVVVLLDSLTRLGRAYHQAGSGSGRAAAGAVDVAALYPAKKLFGSARNLEDGGSLTIVATGQVESGSRVDEAVLEEFQDTATMELRLDRSLADQRIYPAVDVSASSTRREELLLDADELAITWKLRRSLADVGAKEALESVLGRLQSSGSNAELLLQARSL